MFPNFLGAGNRLKILGNILEENWKIKSLKMALRRQTPPVSHWETVGNRGKQVKNWETGIGKQGQSLMLQSPFFIL